MSGFELAAAILGVSDVCIRVAQTCAKYWKTSKHAAIECKHLSEEVAGLNTLLRHLSGIQDGSPTAAKSLQSSTILARVIQEALVTLNSVDSKLTSVPVGGKHKRALFKAKWPLLKQEVTELVNTLAVIKGNISNILLAHLLEVGISKDQDFPTEHVAKAAKFDPNVDEYQTKCHPETRVDLLSRVMTWCRSDSERVFWLNGMAGTGKSTIARTVCKSLQDATDVAALSFFFKRGEGDRGHVASFVPTLAYQLWQTIPTIRPLVRQPIDDDPDIHTKSLKEQFTTLIFNPLRAYGSKGSPGPTAVVLVIDALDECASDNDIRMIISYLLSCKDEVGSFRLKCFVTSRPELPVRLEFKAGVGKYQDLVLHEIPHPVITHDISAYLKDELDAIRDKFNTEEEEQEDKLDMEWPGAANHRILVQMAVPLFIFAAVLCRFLRDRYWDPQNRLEYVLRYQRKGQESQLAATYSPVLDQLRYKDSLPGSPPRPAADFKLVLAEFHIVVGTIIILEDPISMSELSKLMTVPLRVIKRTLRPLHSVLRVGSSSDEPVRLFHLSFRDFLLDRQAMASNGDTDQHFWIEEKSAHGRVARRCIEYLSTMLVEDITQSRQPGTVKSQIAQDRINSVLGPAAVYASIYWTYHIQYGDHIICDNDYVHHFLSTHLLHWLEALSLAGSTSEACNMLEQIFNMTDVKTGAQALELIADAKRFVMRFRSIISTHPLQIYSSALVFAPLDSTVRRTFEHCIPSWVAQTPDVGRQWSSLLQTLEIPLGEDKNEITCPTFSPNTKILAMGSDAGSIHLWDAHTLRLQVKIEGTTNYKWSPTETIFSLAFSPDSLMLAAATSDDHHVVSLWDARTGTTLHELRGHDEEILSVAFSPIGLVLASGSRDGSIRLWDPVSGKPKTPMHLIPGCINRLTIGSEPPSASDSAHKLPTHSGAIKALLYTPTGLLVSGSSDGTVRVWGTDSTLERTLGPFHGTSRGCPVRTLVFNFHDNTLIVGSGTSVVIISIETGTPLHRLDCNADVWSLAVLNGNQAIIGFTGDDVSRVRTPRNIIVWDYTKGTSISAPNITEAEYMAISTNGTLITTGYRTPVVRLWDISQCLSQPSECRAPSVFPNQMVRLVALPSKQLTVVSHGGSFWHVYDAKSRALLYSFMGGHTTNVHVAWSIDSMLIYTQTSPMEHSIWDMRTAAWSHHLCIPDDFLEHLICGLDHLELSCADRLQKAIIMGSTKCSKVIFAPDTTFVAGIFLRGVVIWGLAEAKDPLVWRCDSFPNRRGQISPDCSMLAIAGLSNIDIVKFSFEDGAIGLKSSFYVSNDMGNIGKELVFSPDSKFLACGTKGGRVLIWDLDSGNLHRQIGYDSTRLVDVPVVRGVAFSSDGELVAACGGNHEDLDILQLSVAKGDDQSRCTSFIAVWDVASGSCLLNIAADHLFSTVLFNGRRELVTDLGNIEVSETPDMLQKTPAEAGLQFLGWRLSNDAKWVTYDGHNVLSVPQAFQPEPCEDFAMQFLEVSSFDPGTSTLVFTAVDGTLVIIGLSEDHRPDV